MAPDSKHQHCARKFDSATGIDTRDPAHYMVQVPQYFRPEGCRSVRPLACMPVHEALARELDEDSSFNEKLTRCVEEIPLRTLGTM